MVRKVGQLRVQMLLIQAGLWVKLLVRCLGEEKTLEGKFGAGIYGFLFTASHF